MAGPKWGRYYVGPIQFMVCYGAVVGSTLLGGQCMKVLTINSLPIVALILSHHITSIYFIFIYFGQTIYLLSNPNGEMKLFEFVIIFGCFMLILAQVPSFHSLRHINLVSLLLCLAYSACAVAGSIHIGNI